MEAQNKEAFLEGMKLLFHHMSGVPKANGFDNLSPAVKKIRPHGKRDLTEEFERFTAHYGFQLEFCNPARGNKKGHVEAMVKYVRNNFLLPEVHTHDLRSLNQDCWVLAENDRKRIHYQKQLPISELYSADKEALLLLPEKEFDCVRYEEVKADKYGYIHFDTNLYSSSPRFALEKVLLKISYEHMTVFSLDYKEIVQHNRLYGYKEKSMDWQPYLSLVSKRPTALKYTSFYDQLPDAWQSYFSQCTVEEKKLNQLLKQSTLPTVNGESFIWNDIQLPSGMTKDFLLQGDFLEHKTNLIFYGGVGTGKIFLYTLIGLTIIRTQAKKVKFYMVACDC